MGPQSLPYHPAQGEVLRCDYRGCVGAEMAKVRWVVVISPKFVNRPGLCTVVPISTSAPYPKANYHVLLDKDPAPNPSGDPAWVKCDMVMTVSFDRLSAPFFGKKNGKRNYVKTMVSDKELEAIRWGVMHALGLGGLCKP